MDELMEELIMGLDMYLSRKRSIPSDRRDQLTIDGLGEPVNNDKVAYIVEEAGYWRKANAIHRWFVAHVQDGNDDCKEYWVSREQLQLLLDTVNAVLENCQLVKGKVWQGTVYENGTATEQWDDGLVVKNPAVAQSLLPTAEGFFFGSTQYDEYYVEDLQETQRMLTEVLSTDDDSDFYYQASW